MSDEIRPFKIHVSDADLEDLKKRLRATRRGGPGFAFFFSVPHDTRGWELKYASCRKDSTSSR